MRPRWLLQLLLSVVIAVPAAAQNPVCTPYTGTGNAFNLCNAAVDGVRAFQPRAGMLVGGGNAELGRVGSLGGLGHLAITLRLTAASVTLPDTEYDGTTTTVGEGQTILVPEATIDAAVGIFEGLESGLLAIDLLAALQLLPTDQIDGLSVDPGAYDIGGVALSLGYGARVGLFGGNDAGVAGAMTIMRRSIPRYTYGDALYTFSTDLRATNLRVVAGYQGRFGSIGVGGGVDWYSSESNATFYDPTLPFIPQTVRLEPTATRYVVFADAAVRLSVVQLAAEIGYQLGEDLGLVTTFQGNDPASGLVFGSFGVKVAL